MSRTPTLLLVDDEPTNVALLARIFDPDYEILAATSGTRALALAVEQIPDLILLDVVLPDMDGYQVLKTLKQHPITSDIPVIFVTARNDHVDEAHGLELGAVDYVTKPISPLVVQMRVRNHLELKRARDLLARQAHFDTLTGLANRRHFDEKMETELRRSHRMREPLSLILIDVDHFKQFNDRYGHQAGDDCLREVAGAIAGSLNRPADLAARYGGEEFACVLPGSALDGAERVAEAVRLAILGLNIPHVGSPHLNVTASLGVASCRPDPDTAARTLIQTADACLYKAKASGRNRYSSA